MVTSQSAATAACFAIDDEVAVQAVDYEKLQTRLMADGQILSWPPLGAAKPAEVDASLHEPLTEATARVWRQGFTELTFGDLDPRELAARVAKAGGRHGIASDVAEP